MCIFVTKLGHSRPQVGGLKKLVQSVLRNGDREGEGRVKE